MTADAVERAAAVPDRVVMLAEKAVHATRWHDAEGECDDPSGCGATTDDAAVVQAVLAALAAADLLAPSEAAAGVRALREHLMSDATRCLMAQDYLIDQNDYHGQDLTCHANAMAAAVQAALEAADRLAAQPEGSACHCSTESALVVCPIHGPSLNDPKAALAAMAAAKRDAAAQPEGSES